MSSYQPLKWAKGTQPVWVPCEKALPLHGELVLIQTNLGSFTIGYVYDLAQAYEAGDYDKEDRFGFETVEEYYGYDGFSSGYMYPVAWCYLPMPYDPEGKNKDETGTYYVQDEFKTYY